MNNTSQITATASIGDDILRGAPKISRYIGENLRRTYYLLENEIIPAGKQGTLWIASKRRLRDHYERLTGGEGA